MDFSTTQPSPHTTPQALAKNLVHQHIIKCATPLVSHFSDNLNALDGSDYSHEYDLRPILEKVDTGSIQTFSDSIEVDYISALEHWIVTDWLGARLFEKGEMVSELFGLHIWGRTTSGQAIHMDNVIEQIAAKEKKKFTA